MASTRRARQWIINGALVGASLLVFIGLAEITLRVVGFADPVFWTYDDVTGSRLYPGAAGWYQSEGEAYVTISSAGLRDREHAVPKPPGTLRVAVLGDSMAEALQVPLESNFSSLLERTLKACKAFAGRDVEVMNFGVSGYGTAQELLMFRHRVRAYSPDITILAFYAGNDVRNNSRELEPNKLRPFYVLQAGQLVLDDSFRSDPEYQSFKSTFELRSNFFGLRVFQFARRIKNIVEQRREIATTGARGVTSEPGADDQVFVSPATAVWKDAWEITERLIVMLRDEVVAAGGRLLVLSIPIAVEAYPDPGARMQFMKRLGVPDLWYPEKRLQQFAERENLDVITLGERFQSYADRDRTYLYGFPNTHLGSGHLNENGHKLVAEALAQHLCPVP